MVSAPSSTSRVITPPSSAPRRRASKGGPTPATTIRTRSASSSRCLTIWPRREPLGDARRSLRSRPSGETIDILRVALLAGPVRRERPGADGSCAASAPLRFVIDEVDQKHPLVRDRSLRAEVGGAIAFVRGGRKLQAIRVLGPRHTSAGPIGRLRATLRPVVLRVAPGGGPSVGGSDAGAMALLRGELALASAIWGQCGVTFGSPPGSCESSIPRRRISSLSATTSASRASGGELRFRVEGHEVALRLRAGRPRAASRTKSRAPSNAPGSWPSSLPTRASRRARAAA